MKMMYRASRRNIILQLCLLLRSIHSISGIDSRLGVLFFKKTDLRKLSNLFGMNEFN